MRKINLKNLSTIGVEQLSREDLRDVLGGQEAATTTSDCGAFLVKCYRNGQYVGCLTPSGCEKYLEP